MKKNTEMIVFKSNHHLNVYGFCLMTIGDDTVPSVDCERNEIVHMNQNLTMIHHVKLCVLRVIILCTDCHQNVIIIQLKPPQMLSTLLGHRSKSLAMYNWH